MTTIIDPKEQELVFTFQWTVGDLRPFEKGLFETAKSSHYYWISFTSRLVAMGLTCGVSYFLFPNQELWRAVLVATAASYSIWASWTLTLLTMKQFERINAQDPMRVGFNRVMLDSRGITWTTDISQEYISWMGISSVENINDSIWFKSGKTGGFFLPNRLFDTQEEIKSVITKTELFRKKFTAPTHLHYDTETPAIKH